MIWFKFENKVDKHFFLQTGMKRPEIFPLILIMRQSVKNT